MSNHFMGITTDNQTDIQQDMCLLTINISRAIVQDFVEQLRQVPELIKGFTCVDATGYGTTVHYRSNLEQVLGSTKRNLILITLPLQHINALFLYLKTQFQRVDIFYWITPVLAVGHLSDYVAIEPAPPYVQNVPQQHQEASAVIHTDELVVINNSGEQ